MNIIHLLSKQQVTTRFFAAVTIAALLLSALPAAFFVAHAANTSAVGTVTATVLPDPAGASEYFTISFAGSGTLDLSGWTVSDALASPGLVYTFGATTLTNGQSFKVCGSTALGVGCDAQGVGGNAVWNNGGDTLVLKDETAATILSVVFGAATASTEYTNSIAVNYAPVTCTPQFNVAGPTNIKNVETSEFFDSVNDALADCDTTNGNTIELLGNITTSSQINITRPITLDGNGFTLAPTFARIDNSNNTAIGILGTTNVTIKDLTIDGVGGTNLHGINLYESDPVILNNLTITNNDRSAVVVNSSIAVITDIKTSGNGTSGNWAVIDVDKKTSKPAELTVNGVSAHTEVSPSPNTHIRAADVSKVMVTDSTSQYDYLAFPIPQTTITMGLYTLKSPTPVKECQIGQNLLANASFETPNPVANSAYGGVWEIFSSVIGWTISSDGLEIWDGLFGGASDGEQNAELDGNQSTNISQLVTTIPGATYELKFDFSARPGTGLADNSITAKADGTDVVTASADGTSLTNNSWNPFAGTFVAGDNQTEVKFVDNGTSNKLGSLLDNTVLCLVSEPQPVPVNTCVLPDALEDKAPFVIGNSGEPTLDSVFDANGFAAVDENADEANTQVWDFASASSNSTTFTVTLLAKYAGNNQAFGYYEAGDSGSFVPVFEVGANSAAVPTLAIGSSIQVTIPNNGSFGFGLNTQAGTASTTWLSEFALNPATQDNLAVYNPANNTYLLAFEDLSRGGDRDYNDLVVKIDAVGCNDKAPTATVTMCKTDSQSTPLPNWQLSLLGNKIENLVVPASSAAGVTTVATLNPNRSYVAFAEGTWANNRGPLNTVDAEYSTEDAWLTQMDGFTGYGTNILELSINNETDPASAWGPYSATHKYAQGFTQTSTGTAKFNIQDTFYGDNTGELAVEVFAGFTGLTGTNGCTTFTDVPYGTYTPHEILQTGWQNVSGLSNLIVNQPQVTHTIVNRSSDTPAEQCTLEMYSDAGTVVVETNQYATSTWDGHDSWQADIPGATWIWPTYYIENPTGETVYTFEETFTVNNPTFADLDIAADNDYEITINGVVEFSYTGDSNYGFLSKDDLNLLPYLDEGPNTIRIKVKNFALQNATKLQNPGGLLYKLVVKGDKNNSCKVTTATKPPVVIDVCLNLEGNQTTIPAGYEKLGDSNNCTLIPVIPVDVCSNLDGNQATIPAGLEKVGQSNECTPIPPTITPSDNSGNGGGGTRTGSRRSAPGGEVLGASTMQCGMYLFDYMREGRVNSEFEVKKLQWFLIGQGYVLPVTGIFDDATDTAVKAFQLKYQLEVLTPWFVAGIVPHNNPTGWVYQLTRWKINNIVCPGSEAAPVLLP